MKDMLKEFPVVIEISVAWGDMDAFQHVNNTVYFKYFESVRLAYFEKAGFMDVMNKTGIGPILASARCDFKAPLTYPDTISVGSKISQIQDDRFTMLYRIVSHKLQRIAAEGEGLVVSYNYQENKKAPLPEEIRVSVLELENLNLD
jgi:acyl-CoA thioester hydrolase